MKSAALAVSALALGALAAAPRQDPEIQIVKVTDEVAMLVGRGGNIGLFTGPDGLLMIDTKFADLAEPIRAAIAEFADDAPSFVVNTHWHGDHVGGNAAFGRDGLLVAHERVRARMQAGGRGAGPAAPEALPDLTYDEGMTIHFNGQPVHLVHLPQGHTDGDTVVMLPDLDVVHMGDLLFNGMFPFVDLQSGGSVRGYLQSMDAVLAKLGEGTQVIPGHGPLADRADVRAARDMLAASIELMEARIAEGMSREEAIAAGMPEKWAGWSWNFITTERWLGTLYDDLGAEEEGGR